MSVGAPPRTGPTPPSVRLASDGLPMPRIGRRRNLGTAAATASIAMGIGAFAAAPLRGQPEELLGGLLLIVTSALVLGLVLRAAPDATALPVVIALGWFAQAGASLIYYYTDVAQDAAAYHGLAESYAAGRIPFEVPDRQWGIQIAAGALSLVYRVTGPSKLMGFLLFAIVGLVAKALVARRLLELRGVLGPGGEVGAVALVLLPSLNWWLGAISKESLAILGIGIVVHGLVRIDGRPPSGTQIIVGLAIIASVRAHISLLLGAAVVAYLLLAFALPRRRGGKRVTVLIAGGAAFAVSLVAAAAYLGTDATLAGLEERRVQLSGVADPGGSNIEPAPIRSPLDIPAALTNVILRPTLFEAYNLVTFAQAVESTLLTVALLWLVAQGRRRARNPRRGADALQIRAIRAFGLAYTSGFIFAFSITYNLGLVSRQRAQMWLPAMLLLATALVRVVRGPAGGGASGPMPVSGATAASTSSPRPRPDRSAAPAANAPVRRTPTGRRMHVPRGAPPGSTAMRRRGAR